MLIFSSFNLFLKVIFEYNWKILVMKVFHLHYDEMFLSIWWKDIPVICWPGNVIPFRASLGEINPFLLLSTSLNVNLSSMVTRGFWKCCVSALINCLNCSNVIHPVFPFNSAIYVSIVSLRKRWNGSFWKTNRRKSFVDIFSVLS